MMFLRMGTLTILSATLVAISSTAVTARPHENSARVVEAAIESIERMNLQGLRQFLAPNARFDNMFSLPNSPSTFQGRDAVIANIREIAERFEQIEFVDERLYLAQDGKTVFVEARGNFAVKGTDTLYQNTYIFVFEVRNGQITAVREYNNPLVIIETFNVPLPEPAIR